MALATSFVASWGFLFHKINQDYIRTKLFLTTTTYVRHHYYQDTSFIDVRREEDVATLQNCTWVVFGVKTVVLVVMLGSVNSVAAVVVVRRCTRFRNIKHNVPCSRISNVSSRTTVSRKGIERRSRFSTSHFKFAPKTAWWHFQLHVILLVGIN